MADAPIDIHDALLTDLQRAGEVFLSLSEVRSRLPIDALWALNLWRSSSTGEVADAVSPPLGPDMVFHRQGRAVSGEPERGAEGDGTKTIRRSGRRRLPKRGRSRFGHDQMIRGRRERGSRGEP